MFLFELTGGIIPRFFYLLERIDIGKYKIIATDSRTNKRYVYCGFAGREWFAELPCLGERLFPFAKLSYHYDRIRLWDSIPIANSEGIEFRPTIHFRFSTEGNYAN